MSPREQKKEETKNDNPPNQKTEAAPAPKVETAPTVEAAPEVEKETKEVRRDRLRQKKVVPNPENTYKGNIPKFDPKLQKLFEAPNGDVLVGGIKDHYMSYRIPGTSNIMKINPMRRSTYAHRKPEEEKK